MCRAAAAAAAAATKPAIFPLLVFAPDFSISDKERPKKSEQKHSKEQLPQVEPSTSQTPMLNPSQAEQKAGVAAD